MRYVFVAVLTTLISVTSFSASAGKSKSLLERKPKKILNQGLERFARRMLKGPIVSRDNLYQVSIGEVKEKGMIFHFHRTGEEGCCTAENAMGSMAIKTNGTVKIMGAYGSRYIALFDDSEEKTLVKIIKSYQRSKNIKELEETVSGDLIVDYMGLYVAAISFLETGGAKGSVEILESRLREFGFPESIYQLLVGDLNSSLNSAKEKIDKVESELRGSIEGDFKSSIRFGAVPLALGWAASFVQPEAFAVGVVGAVIGVVVGSVLDRNRAEDESVNELPKMISENQDVIENRKIMDEVNKLIGQIDREFEQHGCSESVK